MANGRLAVLGERTVVTFPRRQAGWAAAWAVFGASFATPAGAVPESPHDSSTAPTDASVVGAAPRLETFTLANGLRVVLVPDPDAPVLSVCTTFDAGVRREPTHAPGVARVVAELLRNGGRPTESQDLGALLASRGGSAEFDFGHDALTFCQTVPSAELEFALWYEAGRFGSYALTEQGRSRVVDELSAEFERLDESATSERAPRRLRALAFQGRPSYARSTLASSAQLAEVELEELKAFHRDHFSAGQAVVAIVGDFETKAARTLVEQQLGPVPGGTAPAGFELELPHQTTERFSMIEDPAASVPAAWYGWVLPALGDKQRDALELVAFALASESRLGGSIVGQRRPAQSLEAQVSGEVGPELFALHAVGTGPAALENIERALDAELTKLGQFGLSAEELTAAHARRKHARAAELASNLGKARVLSRASLFGQGPEQVLNRADPLGAESDVTNTAIARAVREYLQPRRRTVIEVYPKGWNDPWQTPMPTYHLVSAGENLARIAAMHDTSVEVIAKMNGLDQKKPIHPGQNLKVPRSKATSVKAVVHTVRSGDTLSGIARKFSVSVQSLADANGIDAKRPIRPGDELRVPARSGKASSGKPSGNKPAGRTHKVKAGETLGGIALRYSVSTASLAAANGLAGKTTIRVGQTLQVPPAGTGKPAGGSAAGKPKASPLVHEVRGGETLGGIAKKYGVSVVGIAQANGISQKKPIRVGQRLIIPR